MTSSGWKIYLSHGVLRIYQKLKENHDRLLSEDPVKNQTHPSVRDFRNIRKAMWDAVCNPQEKGYRLGNTLGKDHRGWRRLKRDMPYRYRFFFRFFTETKEIFFMWINDEKHIRRTGHKDDVYREFERRLDSGDVPSSRSEMLLDSEVCDEEVLKLPPTKT